MGKQKERIRQIEDPELIKFLGVESSRAKKPTGLLPGGSTGYANVNKDKSKFDETYNPGLDFFLEENPYEADKIHEVALDEHRAQNQPKGEKWLHGFGRLLSKTGTEFGKGLGYIGGAFPALLSGDIEKMTDNFFVSIFQNMEDATKEDLPVFVREEVENGSLARQIWSPEFWANEGADGLGFMLSAILSGGTVAAGSRALKLSTVIAQSLNKGQKTANFIDNALITGTQTFVEAAAETKGIVDELKLDWDKFKQEDGSFIKNGVTYSPEEISSKIGQAGVETMILNSLLLIPSNSIQTKMLFGKGDDIKGIFSKMDVSSPEAMKDAIKKITPWKSASSKGLTEGIKSMGAEAFQELSQFAVEDYESKKGKGLTDTNFIAGLIEGYKEGLTTIEGQKSMFLGAVFGLGPGVVGAYKATKKELSQKNKLITLMATSSEAFKKDLTSIYKRNEEGGIEVDIDGKPVVDPKKLTELIDSVFQDMMHSKLYQEAKLNKNIDGAKHALTEITVRNLYPYLQTDGGLALWKEHSSETAKLLENNAVDLGFENKEEYTKYLDGIAEKAKVEYNKVKNMGPAFFGLNTKSLIKNKEDKANVAEKMNTFIARTEFNAVRLSVINDDLTDQLKQVKTDIQTLRSKLILKDEQTVDEALAESKISSILNKVMLNKQNAIENSIASVGETYASLFDKEQQQEAFDAFVKSEEKIEEGIKEDEIKQEDDEAFINNFYKKLTDKGYDVSKSEDGQVNDFGKNNVSLKDNEGQVYRIEKRTDEKTKTTGFVLRNLDTNTEVPLTTDALKELNLNNAENILTKEEFQGWVKLKKVTERNTKRLEALSKLISDHRRTKSRFNKELRDLKEELARYEEELTFWKNNTKGLDALDVLIEIETIESKITDLTSKIDQLSDKKTSLEQTLLTLRQLKTELVNVINEGNKQEFSFGVKVKELERKLSDGDFDLDIDIVEESIVILDEWVKELSLVRSNLIDTKNSLLEAIIEINNIELLFDGIINSKSLAQKLRTNYPSIMVGNQEIGNMTKTDLRKILSDKSTRSQLLNEQQGAKRDLMSSYNVNAQELKDINKEISKLQKQLGKFKQNRSLLLKYEKLNINLRTLEKRNKISELKSLETNISNNQRKDFSTSPQEQVISDRGAVLERTLKKTNPYSTVTSVYDIKRKKADGTFELHKNWKQAARWSRVMNKIDLAKLSNYSVRFVNNAQLEKLGQAAPVTDDNALYSVLYSNIDKSPYTDDQGIIFTGVANPETYFGPDYTSIDVVRIPEYQKYFTKEVSEKNPVVFNNKEYTSHDELKTAITSELNDQYTQWRQDLLDKVNSGEELYSAILDISAGRPRFGETKRKVKEVLDVVSVKVPRTNEIMKSNGRAGTIAVENGMPYVELSNGQLQRVLNKRIDELEDKDKAKYINKILKFMTLAGQVKNHNFKQQFNFKGSKSKISLFGGANRTGIMDLLINWGRTSNNEFGIAIYPKVKGDVSSPLEIVFDFKGEKEKMNLSNLIDENGNTRVMGDPEIQTLVDFLETKFMNVDYRSLGNTKLKNGFWIPKDWHLENGIPVITYDKHKSYEDYVLDNNLYTNIEPFNEETDDIPNFVNNYITFDTKLTPKLKEIKAKEVVPKNETTKIEGIPERKLTSIIESFKEEVNLEPTSDLGALEALIASGKKEESLPVKPKEKKKKCKKNKKPNFGKKGGTLSNLKA